MRNYVIECPVCGAYAEAKTGIFGLFSTKKIKCPGGHTIDVKASRMSIRECPHCKNQVIFDQGKGENAKCPVCHGLINTKADIVNTVSFHCPSCSCQLTANKKIYYKDNAERYLCPLCETSIDVKKQVDREKALADGQTQVIEYEGGIDSVVWRHSLTSFNSGSQLIVGESQEALFFRDGKALDLFKSGRYTINDAQLPIAKQNEVLWEDEGQTFRSQVYYINLSNQMAIKWGTSDKVTFIEPSSKAPIAIGARGMMNCRVSDSRKLILKLVGTTSGLTRQDMFDGDDNASESKIKEYFRSIIKLGVSTKLAETISNNNIDILQIDKDKLELSKIMKEVLTPYLEDYGIAITEFIVEGIILPASGEIGYDTVQALIKLRKSHLEKTVLANDTEMKLSQMEAERSVSERSSQIDTELEKSRREVMAARQETELLKAQLEGKTELEKTKAEVEAQRLRMELEMEKARFEAQLEMEKKRQTAQIEGDEMKLKGYTQKDVIQGQVLTAYAENQPSIVGTTGNGTANPAIQIGAGIAMAKAVADMSSDMLGKVSSVYEGAYDSGIWNCSCGKIGNTGNFCDNCGSRRPSPVKSLWNCSCGRNGLTGNFCDNCGKKRDEQT